MITTSTDNNLTIDTSLDLTDMTENRVEIAVSNYFENARKRALQEIESIRKKM